MVPVVSIPFSLLRPTPDISTTPLMLVLLEVCLRLNGSSCASSNGPSSNGPSSSRSSSSSGTGSSNASNSADRGSSTSSQDGVSRHSRGSSNSRSSASTHLQILHLLGTVSEPERCTSISAAGSCWPVVLPLVGALVSSSKVLRSSSWDMSSMKQACTLHASIVRQVAVLTAAWGALL